MKLSNRILEIAPSGSIAIAEQISKLRRDGKEIIGLNVGEPDFNAHDNIIDQTISALTSGKTRYSLVAGELPLREAISNYVNEKFKIDSTVENILIGNGSKQIIYNAFQAILNPQDEVIVPIPYWVTIPESVKLAGGYPVLVPSTKDFHLDIQSIQNAITNKTKAIYINTPNNPSGVVYTQSELKELEKIIVENDLYLISDEAYEALVYDHDFISPLCISDELKKRTICIQSFSKTFCMTGFRIGYMIAKKEIISSISKFQGHLCGNVAPFTQLGAVAALESKDQILQPILEEMRQRRDLSYELFSTIFPCHKPEGAFYLFLDIKEYIDKGIVKNSVEMVEYLIHKAGVALVPGSSFGQEGYIRLAYTADQNELKRAFQQIKEALK